MMYKIEDIKNKVHCSDCLDFMREMPDNSVDLVVCDPPFNISQDKKELSRKTRNSLMFAKRTSVRLDFGDWDKRAEIDYKKFIATWFKEIKRILKPKGWCFIFFSKERTGYFTNPLDGLFVENGFKTRTIISWHKRNPTPSFRKVNFLSSCEFCIVGSKGESRIPNFLMQKEMHNFFETANKSAYGKTKHPTEKPISLIKWMIKIGSKENDLILDTFLGSGTTAVAAKSLNRDFIGVEISKEYCDIANKRLKQDYFKF